jgi:16S rRNA (guanine966-N2)-methyltransferase
MLSITGGHLKGKRLTIPAHWPIRPTTALVRQAVFQRVNVVACRFLDLFAGSGLMSWEAYSRGASHIVCIDRARAHCQHLIATAKAWGVPAHVVCRSAERFLQKPPNQPPFDVVFIDPPYAYTQWALLFPLLVAWTHKDSTLIIEHDKHAQLGLPHADTRPYGNSLITMVTHQQLLLLP